MAETKVGSSTSSRSTQSLWLWGILVFFGVVSLGQLQRIELSGLPAFYAHDVIMVVFVAWMMLQNGFLQFLRRMVQKIPLVGWVCLAWVGAGLALAFTQHTSIIYSLMILTRCALYGLAALGLAFTLKRKNFSLPLITIGLTFFFTMVLAFGALQYIFVPDTRFLFFLGWDDHYYRLISTLFDPGFTGLILALGYLFVQEYLGRRSALLKVPVLRTILVLLSIALLTGVLFTYSRASYLAVGVIIFFLVWKHWTLGQLRNAFLQSVIATIFVVSLFFLPQPGGEGVKLGRTSTITARAITAQESLATFNSPQALLIGEGLFVPPSQIASLYTGSTSHAKVADNWIIALLSGTGIIGTILVCAVLFQVLQRTYNTPHSYLWIALLAVLVHGLFNASVTFPFVWIVLMSWGVRSAE